MLKLFQKTKENKTRKKNKNKTKQNKHTKNLPNPFHEARITQIPKPDKKERTIGQYLS